MKETLRSIIGTYFLRLGFKALPDSEMKKDTASALYNIFDRQIKRLKEEEI